MAIILIYRFETGILIDYGEYCAYEWRERDYGGTYTHEYVYEADGHTITFEFEHEGGDEFFGRTVVNFDDWEERTYDLGDLEFELSFVDP